MGQKSYHDLIKKELKKQQKKRKKNKNKKNFKVKTILSKAGGKIGK
tara:strand:- start:149 stop:286 length:138 start_codon:yes stop_codon:yes gene_type:complete